MTLRLSRPLIYGFLGMLTIWCTGLCVVQSSHFVEKPTLLSLAVTFDVVLLAPLVYLWAIWDTKIPKKTAFPVFVLSLVAAHGLLPSAHQQGLTWIKAVLVPVETLISAFVLWKVVQIRKAFKAEGETLDFLSTARKSFAQVLGEGLPSRIAASELGTFYYGLWSWRRDPALDHDGSFSIHRRAGLGAILGVFLFLIVVETVMLHIWLASWSPVAAWIASFLSVYSAVFLVADYNAFRQRPIVVEDDGLWVRVGMRAEVKIPWEAIERFEFCGPEPSEDAPGLWLRLHGTMSPNIILTLKEAREAMIIYGIHKRFDHMTLFVDEPKALIQAVDKARS